MEYKDYYKILGVSKDADDKAIKRAYRQLARQYHPDKNPGDRKSEETFKEINEAYEVLGDADNRSKYDRLGRNYQRYQQITGSGNPHLQSWINILAKDSQASSMATRVNPWNQYWDMACYLHAW